MSELTIKLASFEGPLDLLLHLIKELKIDIYDIPMVELTEQYLLYIHSMKTLELDVAAEYLVMAATLLEIKSRMLLPKPPVEEREEEEIDPRQVLVDRLLEYQQFQESAKLLEEKALIRSSYFTKEMTDLTLLQQSVPLREGELSTQDLWEALKKLARKTQSKQPIQANVYHEMYAIEDIMETIVEKITLADNRELPLHECFPELNRHAITTTFLAMLQLVRSRQIMFKQNDEREIYLLSI